MLNPNTVLLAFVIFLSAVMLFLEIHLAAESLRKAIDRMAEAIEKGH